MAHQLLLQVPAKRGHRRLFLGGTRVALARTRQCPLLCRAASNWNARRPARRPPVQNGMADRHVHVEQRRAGQVRRRRRAGLALLSRRGVERRAAGVAGGEQQCTRADELEGSAHDALAVLGRPRAAVAGDVGRLAFVPHRHLLQRGHGAAASGGWGRQTPIILGRVRRPSAARAGVAEPLDLPSVRQGVGLALRWAAGSAAACAVAAHSRARKRARELWRATPAEAARQGALPPQPCARCAGRARRWRRGPLRHSASRPRPPCAGRRAAPLVLPVASHNNRAL